MMKSLKYCQMILKPQDLRKVRPIAENINDPARIEPYIREAESLRLVDLLGATLYKWIEETDFSSPGPFVFTKDNGEQVELTAEDAKTLLDGGYYTDDCGKGQMTEGLRTGIAYLAYARFIMNNPVNPTAFGVRYKNGEFSTEVEDSVIARTAAEARKIGEAYLAKAMEYIKALGLLPSCTVPPRNPAFSLRINRKKL